MTNRYKICTIWEDDLFFEWDTNKDKVNLKNHGICFDIAKRVFYDENRIELFDEKHSSPEDERFITIGLVDVVTKVVMVVYTVRTGNIRIISARLANAEEKEVYFNGNY